MSKSKAKWIVPAVLVISLVGLMLYNLLCNDDFFEASFISVVNAGIVLSVSFYLTQMMNDRREQVKHIEKILYDISVTVSSEKFFCADDEEKRNIAKLSQRKVSNKITILEEYNLIGETKKSVDGLKNVFKEAREFYGNHMNDSEYIRKSEKEIADYVEKMEKYCDQICRELYLEM